MKHHRSIGAGCDEGKVHTFVMDYCFPSQGSQQGITVLVIEETKIKAISTFMVLNKGASEYLVKAVADSISGCGCGRAILNSDGELAIVALQEAVKNSRKSDKILENSRKRRQSVKRSSRERSKESRRNDTHVEDTASVLSRSVNVHHNDDETRPTLPPHTCATMSIRNRQHASHCPDPSESTGS